MPRLIKERGLARITDVDASVRILEAAHCKLRLNRAGDAMAKRVSLQIGSLVVNPRGQLLDGQARPSPQPKLDNLCLVSNFQADIQSSLVD